MLTLEDVRDYIASIGISEDGSVYCGKLDNKKERSIGVYPRKSEGSPRIALGGDANTAHDIKPISLLVHWNKGPRDAETAAFKLFEHIRKETKVTIRDTHISYIRLMVPEPQGIGTDEDGIYEYVIWLDFIYERKGA